MNPKPFSALNHFTVPCGISRSFLLFLPGAVHRLPAYRARSDRHTFVESSELTRPTTLAGTAIATTILRVRVTNTEAATVVSQSRSPLVRQSRRAVCGEQFVYRAGSVGPECVPGGHRVSESGLDFGGREERSGPGGSDEQSGFGRELLACAVDGTPAEEHPLRHVADLPPRQGYPSEWPPWADPDVVRAFHDRGITAPWAHQLAAAQLAHDGRHVVISTGTASGKSLAYQLPILSTLATDPRARVLYLSPTKALGHDQLRAAHTLTESVTALRDVAPVSYDGDSPTEVRRFARE